MNGTSQKKILLIDDDTILQKMYAKKLENEGYRVITAGDGEEALEIFKAEVPDLILCDIMLPRVSGVEFITKLRSLDKGKNVNVIAWSNLKKEQEEEKLKDLGVKGFLDKNKMSLNDVATVVKNYT